MNTNNQLINKSNKTCELQPLEDRISLFGNLSNEDQISIFGSDLEEVEYPGFAAQPYQVETNSAQELENDQKRYSVSRSIKKSTKSEAKPGMRRRARTKLKTKLQEKIRQSLEEENLYLPKSDLSIENQKLEVIRRVIRGEVEKDLYVSDAASFLSCKSVDLYSNSDMREDLNGISTFSSAFCSDFEQTEAISRGPKKRAENLNSNSIKVLLDKSSRVQNSFAPSLNKLKSIFFEIKSKI